MGSDPSSFNTAEAAQAAQEALRRSYLTARSQMLVNEAIESAQEAVRSYLEQSAVVGHRFLAAWRGAAQANLRQAFGLQDSSLAASRSIVESVTKASPAWLDRAASSIREGQEATAEALAAGFALVESALPGARLPRL